MKNEVKPRITQTDIKKAFKLRAKIEKEHPFKENFASGKTKQILINR